LNRKTLCHRSIRGIAT